MSISKKYFFVFFIILILSLSIEAAKLSNIGKRAVDLKGKRLSFIGVSISEEQNFLFEYGFLGRKSIFGWPLNAYVGAMIFHKDIAVKEVKASINSEATDSSALGALIIKAGVLIPTNVFFGLSVYGSFGYGKSNIQENPWWGRESNSQLRESIYLAEGGLLYHHNKFLVRFFYTTTTNPVLKGQSNLTIGMNF